MKGFLYRNLQYIRQWYLFYNQGNIIVQQVVAQLQKGHGQQPIVQISEDVFFSVPWGIICISYRKASCLQLKILKQHFLI